MTKGVVPRVIVAQRAEAAFPDLHFAQTSMVLTRGKTRADELADLAAAEKAVAALRKTDREGGAASRVAASPPIETWKILDDKLYSAVKRGDTGYAEQTVAGYADAAADNVLTAIERYITQAERDRAQADQRFVTLESSTRRTASPSACWRCSSRSASPSPSRATSAGACAPSRRPPRRLPAAMSTTSSPSAAATRSGAPRVPSPRWSSISARWPVPPTAWPPAT